MKRVANKFYHENQILCWRCFWKLLGIQNEKKSQIFVIKVKSWKIPLKQSIDGKLPKAVFLNLSVLTSLWLLWVKKFKQFLMSNFLQILLRCLYHKKVWEALTKRDMKVDLLSEYWFLWPSNIFQILGIIRRCVVCGN